MMTEPTETPRDLARRLYREFPRAVQPIEVDGDPHWQGVEHLPEWHFCERLAERLHEAEHAESYSMSVLLPLGDFEQAALAIADVLFWFAGFKAAGGFSEIDGAEPDLASLRKLKDAIDRRAVRERDKPYVIPGRPF